MVKRIMVMLMLIFICLIGACSGADDVAELESTSHLSVPLTNVNYGYKLYIQTPSYLKSLAKLTQSQYDWYIQYPSVFNYTDAQALAAAKADAIQSLYFNYYFSVLPKKGGKE